MTANKQMFAPHSAAVSNLRVSLNVSHPVKHFIGRCDRLSGR